jgi:N-acetylneuraminic acid mutarotase
MYVVGGWTDDENFTLLEKYSPQSNTWQTLSPMPAGRENFACAALNGKIYAIGGVDSSTVDVYDPNNDSWSTGTPLPSVVESGTAIGLHGKIYLFSKASNSLLCFDPETDQWLAKANMPTPRTAAKVVYHKERIWAIGGLDGAGAKSNTVESYNPLDDSWQSEANTSDRRLWALAWVANGRIYVAGGLTGSGLTDSVEIYNKICC